MRVLGPHSYVFSTKHHVPSSLEDAPYLTVSIEVTRQTIKQKNGTFILVSLFRTGPLFPDYDSSVAPKEKTLVDLI